MPTKARTSKSARKTTRPSSKVVGSGPRGRFGGRSLLFAAILVFGSVGVYLLAASGALRPDDVLLPDDAARGVIYQGKKVKTNGPCAGEFDETTAEDEKEFKDKRRCAHFDPTPKGVDIRERVKKVDAELAAMAAHDEKNPPVASDDTSGNQQPPMETAETISAGSMAGLSGRKWPCIGSGLEGPRVFMIYVYPAGGTNRLSDLRSSFASIASRTNNIFYESGTESGNAHQIRFATNVTSSGCSLKIAAEGIRGDMLDDQNYVWNVLKERGYKGVPAQYDTNGDGTPDITKYVDRKYMVWIDKQYTNSKGQIIKCGIGQKAVDDSPDQSNANNHMVSYAAVWKGCWNYGEPHELMHMLGGVQSRYVSSTGVVLSVGSPHATKYSHCYDERDVMCYDDGSGIAMRSVCTRAIDWWRFDCGKNDYYRGNSPSTGYLSNHWNTANNRFLTR